MRLLSGTIGGRAGRASFVQLCDTAICGVRRELESLAGQYAAKLAGHDRPQQEIGTVAVSDCRTVVSPVQYWAIARPLTDAAARSAAPY